MSESRPLLDVLRRALASGEFRMPLAEHLGLRLNSVEEGKVTVSMTPQPFHKNIMGTVHGGILCSLADAAMGLAFGSTLPAGDTFTTVELKINYTRPVFDQTLHAHGSLVHKGKTTGVLQCHIVDDAGKLVAFATSTCTVLHGDAASGRTILPGFGG
jgi:uncharacterized protein (TIGR00369 family)